MLFKSHDGRGFVAGEIWLHADVGMPVSLIDSWELVSYSEVLGAAERRVATNPILVATEDILCTCIHCRCDPGVERTLVPWGLRSLRAGERGAPARHAPFLCGAGPPQRATPLAGGLHNMPIPLT